MKEDIFDFGEDQFGFTMDDKEILRSLRSGQKGWKSERRVAKTSKYK